MEGYEVDISNIKELLNHYSNLMQFKYSESDLFEFLRWGCIQRNLRILGTLSNLYLTKKRSFRLKDLPMILNNLIAMIPGDHESTEFMKNKVKPALVERISEL